MNTPKQSIQMHSHWINISIALSTLYSVLAYGSPVYAERLGTDVLVPSVSTLSTPLLASPEPTIEPVAITQVAITQTVTAQTPTVDELSDVQPTDWAFQAVQSLITNYDLLSGYPDGTFRGNTPLTRNEFAAALSPLLEQLTQLNATGGFTNALTEADLATVQRLQSDFAQELAVLETQLSDLESRVTTLENQSFSLTTKLTGQAVFAVNAGGFSGDRIIAPRGALIRESNPQPTSLHRATLNFNTSFTGADLLHLRLVTGSDGPTDNAAGLLEPNLGSGLDFSFQGRNNNFSIARVYYRFSPQRDLSLTLGASMSIADYIDRNRYAGTSFLDFSTQALVNNFILFPRSRGAGAALEWHPNAGPFTLRAVYIAGDARNTLPENQAVIGGGRTNEIRLFPLAGGGASGGLFGDPYQGTVELEYAPNDDFALRLQYAGGRVFGSNYDVVGINTQLALSDHIGLFGRYGYATYPNTTVGDLSPHYWSAGIALQDVLIERSIAGIGFGQPLIENKVGDSTQTNFEMFYNFPVNNRIRVTPLVQVVTHPGNQSSNGSIFAFTLRTVFAF
jgi:Carbohydrate-selective porin, OprB family/S-layer homology domain